MAATQRRRIRGRGAHVDPDAGEYERDAVSADTVCELLVEDVLGVVEEQPRRCASPNWRVPGRAGSIRGAL